jgi:hypothetical protein
MPASVTPFDCARTIPENRGPGHLYNPDSARLLSSAETLVQPYPREVHEPALDVFGVSFGLLVSPAKLRLLEELARAASE